MNASFRNTSFRNMFVDYTNKSKQFSLFNAAIVKIVWDMQRNIIIKTIKTENKPRCCIKSAFLLHNNTASFRNALRNDDLFSKFKSLSDDDFQNLRWLFWSLSNVCRKFHLWKKYSQKLLSYIKKTLFLLRNDLEILPLLVIVVTS